MLKYPLPPLIWSPELPFSLHLGKYIIKIGKISAEIHEIGKIKAIFRLGMTPILGDKNGQIKSLVKRIYFFLVLQFKHLFPTTFCVLKVTTFISLRHFV